jgi:hypothetical protein
MSDSARTGKSGSVCGGKKDQADANDLAAIYVGGMFGCLSVLVKCAGVAAGY